MDQQQIENFRVREARADPADAQGIAESFQSTYEDYPFTAYTDPEQVESEVLPGDGSRNFVVEVTDEDEPEEESSVVGTGSVKFHEDGTVAELGGAVIKEDFQRRLRRPDGTSAYQELFETRLERAYDEGADIVTTQTVSSTHAKTQYQASKNGFVPTGVSDKKYPEVFRGEGRETTVPMVDADSDFRHTASADEEAPQVYVTEETAALVDHVYSMFNDHRDDELEREMVFADDADDAETGFEVKEKAYDDEVSNLAQYQVLPGGDKSYEEALDTVAEALDDEGVDWVGVEVDANHPSAGELSASLREMGFDLERYSPEELEYRDGTRDALGFQSRPTDTYTVQVLEDVAETAEVMGIPYDEEGGPDVDHVKNVSM